MNPPEHINIIYNIIIKGDEKMSKLNLHNNLLKKFEEGYFLVFLINTVFICTGIVLGIYTIKYMNSINKEDMYSYFSSFVNLSQNQGVDKISILFQSLKNNFIINILVLLCGLTVIGTPFIVILVLIKGFTLGFSISFIITALGTKGIWMTLACILPQNLFFIPTILITASISFQLCINKIKGKFNKYSYNNFKTSSNNYIFYLVICCILIIVGAIVESQISPIIIKNFV